MFSISFRPPMTGPQVVGRRVTRKRQSESGRPSSRASQITAAYARPGSRAAVERHEPYHRPASSVEMHHRPRSSMNVHGPGVGQFQSQFQNETSAGAVDAQFATPTNKRPTALKTPGTLTRRQSAQVLSSTTPSRKSTNVRPTEPRPSLGGRAAGTTKTADAGASTSELGETF